MCPLFGNSAVEGKASPDFWSGQKVAIATVAIWRCCDANLRVLRISVEGEAGQEPGVLG